MEINELDLQWMIWLMVADIEYSLAIQRLLSLV